MTARLTVSTDSGSVKVAFSDRHHGDFNLDRRTAHEVVAAGRRLVDLPWTLVREVHGTDVVEVTEPGEGFGRTGDVIATSAASAVIGVWAADCAPIALIADSGRIVVAHAGWRGIAAGVVDVAMGALDAPVSTAVLGPMIRSCCYEFGLDDIASVAQGIGVETASITAADRHGRPALDVDRALRMTLVAGGVDPDRIHGDGRCTGCARELFSHRRRHETGRHVMAVWRVDDVC